MRLPSPAAALLLLAMPAFAQTPAAPGGTAPVTAPGATAPAASRPVPPRVPLAQRFAEANTTKDGHLTKAQASADRWFYVNREFDLIDADHKGYVTVDDIRNHARQVREARRAALAQSGGQPATTPAKP